MPILLTYESHYCSYFSIDNEYFMWFSESWFIEWPRYLNVFLPHELRVGCAISVAREQRICKLCQLEVECEERFIYRCLTFINIRKRYGDILGTSPLLELKKHRKSLLQDLPVYLAKLKEHLITHYFMEAIMTANIDIHATLGLLHVETYN